MRLPLALALLLALPCAAAPLRPGAPLFTLVAETGWAQPGTVRSRGALGSFGGAFRLTDQLSVVGDLAGQSVRGGGAVASVALGLQALLDATPISPFLEFVMVEIGPRSSVGYQLATRTGFGADWHVTSSLGLGLVVNTLTPLDNTSAGIVGGTQILARFTFVPGAR